MKRQLVSTLVVIALFAVAMMVVAALRLLDGPVEEPATEDRGTEGAAGDANVVEEDGDASADFSRPPPTEHWLGEGAERDNKKARKAWFRERHKAPPEIDVQQIERANGLAQIAKRNALAATRAGRGDGEPEWVERGSDNLAGRMHVAQHSPDQQWLYGGSALGGIWKRDLAGGEWIPLGDNLYGGAHWLAVLPAPASDLPEVLVAATDWGLIHRSEDGGRSWLVPDGVGSPWEVRRLIRTSDGSNTLFLITGTNGNYRLLRSVDMGQSFEQVYSLGGYAGDLWTPRTGESHLYLLVHDEVYSSRDLGDSWSLVGALGIESERGELVGSEAGAPRLWAIVDGNALHRSDDAGLTWGHVTEVVDYWGSLAASVFDVDLFAWGGVEVYRTADGETFDIVNGWGDYYGSPATMLHADIPGIDVLLDAHDQEIWYVSTDGGLYQSLDGLATVENLSLQGLRISQYYSTLTSSVDPGHFAAGSQDQGYQWTTTAGADGDLYSLEQVISGDYGHLTSGDGTHGYVFSVYPGFIMVQVGEVEPWYSWLDFPADEEYGWLPPVVADPDTPEDFYFCATRLYRYSPSGDSWAFEEWSNQQFGESWYEWASALAFSPLDSDLAWAATNYGRLFYSDDHGKTWNASSDLGPESHYFYGTALLPSSSDAGTVWVGGSGYYGTPVYRSTDGGRTYDPWDEGLPDTLVYCLCEAPDGSGTLFAGTETAAYRRDAGGAEWVDITSDVAPVTIYWSCEALTAENTIRFGTYGRGVWDYRLDPDHTGCYPVQDYDADGVMCDEDCDDHDVTVFPGNEDACDGVDVDCDPRSPSEVDEDADGFLACAECDDSDPAVHPDAEDVCDNGVDEDCDGMDASCGGCSCRISPPAPAGLGALSLLVAGILGIRRLRVRCR